ncbi:MAG: hypothetical protein J0H23_11520 [Micrococcales bacterium]|nr:hypothetical protein [Micrococcales bacterium]OJX69411.1 MAG: hypothetical protein BGO94_12895 [Micrococcales bacterium 72-143]
MFKRSILGVGLAVIALVYTAGAAQAAETPPNLTNQETQTVEFDYSPELLTYLDTLSPSERDAFIASTIPATETVTVTQTPVDEAAQASVAEAARSGSAVSPRATGCWVGRADWDIKAIAGNSLYTYYHVGGWCMTGSTVNSAHIADSGAQTWTVGWRYNGVTASSSGVVSNQGRSYTQHNFILGVGGWDIQNTLECGRVNGGDGYYTSSATCGIY